MELLLEMSPITIKYSLLLHLFVPESFLLQNFITDNKSDKAIKGDIIFYCSTTAIYIFTPVAKGCSGGFERMRVCNTQWESTVSTQVIEILIDYEYYLTHI